MDRPAHLLVVTSLFAAGVLVVAGPVYGFDVPRLSVIVTCLVVASLLLAPRLPRAVRVWTSTEKTVVLASVTFAVWIVALTLGSDVPALSWWGQQSRFVGGLTLAVPPLLVLVVPALAPSRMQIERLLWLLVAVLAAGSVYALLQWAGRDVMPWAVERGGRPIGFYGNTNFVGAVLCLATPMAWWVWTRGWHWRVPAVALAISSWLAMYAASVRLGAVAAVGGATVIGLGLLRLSDRRWQGWFIAAVPLGGVIAGVAAVAVGAAIGDRNGIARVSFWRTAVRMWGDSPAVGQGVGRFEPNYRVFRAPEEVTALAPSSGRDLPVDTSHNFLLDLAATAGTPAVLLWVVVLVGVGLILRHGWLSTDPATQTRFLALAAAVGAHAVQSSISVPIVTTVYLGWFLIGLTVAASLAARREEEQRPRRRRRRPGRIVTRSSPAGGRQAVATYRDITAGALAVVIGAAVLLPVWNVWLTTWDLGRGSGALSQGATETALDRGRAATQRTPWWPEPWHLLSEAANAQGQPDLARTAATRAVTADPMDRRGRYLAMEVEQDEDITALGAQLLELRRLDPNGLDVHLDLLRYARIVEDPDLALTAAEVLEQVIEPEHSLWPEVESLGAG